MRKPNVIVITTDQQRCDTLACYGSEFTSTPHLDRLAAEGAICHRAYCTNPVCTPSRASLFSGRYMSRHGAWNVGTRVPGDVPMLSHRLAAAGYRTHYIGKAHFQGFSDPESRESLDGWRETYEEWHGPYYGFESVELSIGHATYGLRGHYGLWLEQRLSEADIAALGQATPVGPEFAGGAYDWDLPTELHSSVWTAERAVDFLATHDAEEPFFLSIGFQDPHHPHCLPTDYPDRLDAADVPSPRYVDGELADKPPHYQLARDGALEGTRFIGRYPMAGQGHGCSVASVADEDQRRGRAYYYSMVKLIDREVGRVLACLDRRALTDNTLIIFTSDHGELLGDHGLWLKGPFHYEELVRIPLLVRWPAGLPSGQGPRGLISHVDIVPTVLAAAGVAIPEGLDGVDAMPLLSGTATEVRDRAMVEFVDDPGALRAKTMVTADRKLTYYHGEDFGELYDLAADPGELRNCWDDPAYSADRLRLTASILDHMEGLERRAVRHCYA